MRRRRFLQAVGCTVPAAGVLARTADRSVGYEPLGSVPVSGATEAAVGPDGRTAYVATGNGFAVVDVSDPGSPTVVESRTYLLSDHEGGPMREIFDLKVDGDRLLVAGPANGHREPSVEGILLYDLSSPRAPRRTGFYETEFPIHNAALDGDHAYLVDSERLVVVDVTGTPGEVGTWRPSDGDAAWADVDGLLLFAHDVSARDDRAYVAEWDAGTFIVDVSDPADPRTVSRVGGRSAETLRSIPDEDAIYHSLGMPGNHHSAAASDDGSLLVLNKEAWKTKLTERKGTDPLGEVELWDVSDERSPTKLATIEAPESRDPKKDGINTTPHNFDLVGDRLYTSWYDGGVKIHDVSDPADPERLAWYRAPYRWTFWTAQRATGEFFVASSHAVGSYNSGKGALVTFPNRPGEQQSPPPLTATPRPSRTVTGTPTATPAATGTGSDATATSTAGATDGTATESGDAVGVPGFGPLAALGGVALAAWRLRSHGESGD